MDYLLNTPFDFIQDPREVFKALLESKDSGTAIGIKSPLLGNGIFVTGVDDILLGDGQENTHIILKSFDFTGHILERNSIVLTDIEGICKFSSKFGNPVLKTLRKILKIS